MVERFEDLVAWQKARDLTRAIYQITQEGTFTREFGLARPIQRAAVSIMSNIAEGFGTQRSKFHQFLSTAKGSVRRSALNSMWHSTSVISEVRVPEAARTSRGGW